MVKDSLTNIPGVRDAFQALIQAYAYEVGLGISAAKSIFGDKLGINANNMARLLRGDQKLTIQHIGSIVEHFNLKFSNNYSLPVWRKLEDLVSEIESHLKYLTFILPSRSDNTNSERGRIADLTPEELSELIMRDENYAYLGIIDCKPQLRDSPFVPQESMKRVQNELYFLGVCGNKWVDQPMDRDLFEEMLERVSNNGGTVRFLLINPSGDAWSELCKLRKAKISNTSFIHYRQLMDNFPILKVRLYNSLPSFRLQFVDDEYVTVSRYKTDYKDWKQVQYGWAAPHLYIRNESKTDIDKNEKHIWSLYPTFQVLYEYLWEGAVELTQDLIDNLDLMP
jgi:hypothetical protein